MKLQVAKRARGASGALSGDMSAMDLDDEEGVGQPLDEFVQLGSWQDWGRFLYKSMHCGLLPGIAVMSMGV